MVIDIQSDGDALYTPSALWTAAHYRLPLLIVMDNNRVYNNRVYNNSMEHAVRMAEARGRDVGNRHVGTEIIDPDVDFAALARSFGIHAEGPILDPADLQPALERAAQVVRIRQQPALVDVVTARSWWSLAGP